ncbi:MAG: DUF4160 domain-containing protein [Magnetococcales bacterium]|nr:DUF4160 domain-containing protein [Magnetococcales bacterium]
MPVISRFLGIIIVMYWNDHAPPHFHARYGDYEITVTIPDGVVEGCFPRRALNLVLEWMQLHRDELMQNWQRCQEHAPLTPIDPLE